MNKEVVNMADEIIEVNIDEEARILIEGIDLENMTKDQVIDHIQCYGYNVGDNISASVVNSALYKVYGDDV